MNGRKKWDGSLKTVNYHHFFQVFGFHQPAEFIYRKNLIKLIFHLSWTFVRSVKPLFSTRFPNGFLINVYAFPHHSFFMDCVLFSVSFSHCCGVIEMSTTDGQNSSLISSLIRWCGETCSTLNWLVFDRLLKSTRVDRAEASKRQREKCGSLYVCVFFHRSLTVFH